MWLSTAIVLCKGNSSGAILSPLTRGKLPLLCMSGAMCCPILPCAHPVIRDAGWDGNVLPGATRPLDALLLHVKQGQSRRMSLNLGVGPRSNSSLAWAWLPWQLTARPAIRWNKEGRTRLGRSIAVVYEKSRKIRAADVPSYLQAHLRHPLQRSPIRQGRPSPLRLWGRYSNPSLVE